MNQVRYTPSRADRLRHPLANAANVLATICLSMQSLFAQPPGMAVDVGYYWQPEREFAFAPGQRVTLYIHGVGAALRENADAGRPPLPTTLNGISAELIESPAKRGRAVPLFAVRVRPACINWTIDYCGAVAMIHLQIPYELKIPPAGEKSRSSLVIFENGLPQAEVRITPTLGQPHVMTGGDTIAAINPQIWLGTPLPLVHHADGELVYSQRPAKLGEVLTLWAVGLGFGGGRAKTGESAPAGITGEVGLAFNFGRNAPALRPGYIPGKSPRPEGLLYAGLAEGQVGIYQVNFRVPDTAPPGTPGCHVWSPIPNLTISIGFGGSGRSTDFDGAPICVDIPDR